MYAMLSGRGCLVRYSATVLQLVFEMSIFQKASTKQLILKYLINKDPERMIRDFDKGDNELQHCSAVADSVLPIHMFELKSIQVIMYQSKKHIFPHRNVKEVTRHLLHPNRPNRLETSILQRSHKSHMSHAMCFYAKQSIIL